MNKRNTEYLFRRYPNLFPEEDRKDPTLSSMWFGFECGDGWFGLIDELCHTITLFVSQNKVDPVRVTQVKEKFGGLRFYYHGGNDLIRGMSWFAEALSFTICEKCGSKGTLRDNGYLKTLCTLCNKPDNILKG